MFVQLLSDHVWQVIRYVNFALPELLVGCAGLTLAYVIIYGIESTLKGFFSNSYMNSTTSLVVTLITLFLWFWVSLALFVYVHMIRNVAL